MNHAGTGIIHAGIGLSTDSDTKDALFAATYRAMEELKAQPSFAIVAATLDHFEDIPRLEELLRIAFGKLPVAGTSSEAISIIDPRHGDRHPEVHRGSAIAVMFVAGEVRAESFSFEDAPVDTDFTPTEDDEDSATRHPESHPTAHEGESAVRAAVQSLDSPISSFLFFADPRAFSIPHLGAITGRTAPEAMAAGGGSTGGGGQLFQMGGGRIISGGCSGLAVARHSNRVAISVSQGGQLVGMRGTITKTEPGRILEIDGEPATLLLDRLKKEDLSVSPERVASLLTLAVAPAGKEALAHGQYMVREINGVDPQRRVLGVNAHVEAGWGVSLLLREAIASRTEVANNARNLKESFDGRTPGFGIYFDCNTRGENLYGVDGVDLAQIRKVIGAFPVLGLSSSFEIGPLWLGDGMTPTALHRHSGVLWTMGTDPDSPLGRRTRAC